MTGQTVIDFDSKVEIQYDGKSEAELTIEVSLIDGFSYRLPVELTVVEGVQLDELTGKTICQCAALLFDKKESRIIRKLSQGRYCFARNLPICFKLLTHSVHVQVSSSQFA